MRCCGSGIFFTEPEAGYELVDRILGDAIAHGGRIVATACPMCQMNLEVYQRKVNKARGTNYDIPVVFITQLMALAFGLDAKEGAAFNYNIIPPETALSAAVA